MRFSQLDIVRNSRRWNVLMLMSTERFCHDLIMHLHCHVIATVHIPHLIGCEVQGPAQQHFLDEIHANNCSIRIPQTSQNKWLLNLCFGALLAA